MKEMTIRIQCPAYLIDYVCSVYGPMPIKFNKASVYHKLIGFYLQKQPEKVSIPDYGKETLIISLPHFEMKNIDCYNYLPPLGAETLRRMIKKEFTIRMFNEVSAALISGCDKKAAIEYFIDRYNLPPEKFDTLAKAMQRFVSTRTNINAEIRRKILSDKRPYSRNNSFQPNSAISENESFLDSDSKGAFQNDRNDKEFIELDSRYFNS